MKNMLNIRVINEAKYILKNKSTVREVAKVFGISKSTVHYDLSIRLPKVHSRLYNKVNKLLKFNLSVRHIRGGIATKKRFLVPGQAA